MYGIMKAGLFGLSAIGFGSSLYSVLKKEEDRPKYKPGPIYSIRSNVVEIRVPRVRIASIIGPNGVTLRKIEEDTDTKIFFKESLSPDVEICVIRGGPGSVVSAQKIVYDKIINYPREETLEIFIPIRVCRNLLLRRGEEMKRIERITETKIAVDHWCFHNNYSTRRVIIKGYSQQIEMAKNELMQLIDDDEEATPFTPNGLIPRLSRVKYWNEDEDDDEFFIAMEDVFRTGDNGLLEVYIASIETPQKFWIQIMGPGVLSVDRLADEMTAFYEKEINQQSHKIEELRTGQLIAIPHNSDHRYYRATIRNIYPDPKRDSDTVLELFYVDFGDIGRYKKNGAYELDEQFKIMRHQAIECSLASIKPKTDWSAADVEAFMNLTNTGAWNTMSARIVEYICPPSHQMRSTPIPCLHLIDTTHNIYTDVNYEFVRSGHAEWDETLDFFKGIVD